MNLWQEVRQRIDDPADPDDLQSALLDAAYLFEKWLARLVTTDRARYEGRGWSSEVAAAPLDEQGCTRLRDAIVALVKREPGRADCSTAYWALGKLGDESLKPLFVQALSRYIGREPHSLYQAMVALSNLGEGVFAGRSSTSTGDPENDELAKSYLARVQAG
jgi:hypothetical protein